MPFRLEHITLADRLELGCLCLLGQGTYGLISDLAAALGTSRQFLYRLRDGARRALEEALAEAGFVLEVTRVLDVEEEVEIRQWTVETKHGRRSFQTHLDDWPRVLPLGGLLIRDVAGDLYRLPPPQTLDARSRELLWAFVD